MVASLSSGYFVASRSIAFSYATLRVRASFSGAPL